MKLYLSSYKLGDNPSRLAALLNDNASVGYVPNALDFTKADPVRRQQNIDDDMALLKGIGLQPELLDLRDYFGTPGDLRKVVSTLGGLWISGGNTFVLRQAMKLSGLDEQLRAMSEDFVYGGYSAAGCVLSPSLEAYQIVDDPTDLPYPEQKEVIWEGLGLIPFAFLPHYDSDHPESSDIAKEKERCVELGLSYKTLRDGEVLIVER